MHRNIHILLAFLTGALLYGEITVRQCPQMTSIIAVPGEYSQSFEITNTDNAPADIQLEMTVRQYSYYNRSGTNDKHCIVVRKTIGANATDTITAAKMIAPPTQLGHYGNNKNVFDYSFSIHAIIRANGNKLFEIPANGLATEKYVSSTYHADGKYSLVSQNLANKLWNHGKRPDEVIVADVSPSQWSTRPAAYSGFSNVMLEEQEEVPQAVKDALMLYASQGGMLVYQSDSQSLMKREKHGLGAIIHLSQNAEQLIHMGDRAIAWQHCNGNRTPPMPEYPKPPVRLYAIFLVVAILMLGPGVWFWLLWRKKPLHSLWLTPLLAILASLVTLGIAICNEGTHVRGTVKSVGFYDQLTGVLTYDASISTYIPLGRTELLLHNDDLVGLSQKSFEDTLCDAGGKHVNGAVRSREVCSFWVNGWRDLSSEKNTQLFELQKNSDNTIAVKNLSAMTFSEIIVQDGQDCYAYMSSDQHKPVKAGETAVLSHAFTDDRLLASGRFRIKMEDQPLFGDVAGLSFDSTKGTQTLYGRWK